MSKTVTMMDMDDAQAEARLSAWRKLAAALVLAFRKLWAAIFGGTVEDLRGDLATAKRVAGKAADLGTQALVGAGKGLDVGLRATHGAASVVGSIAGALLPRAPVGPADIEAAAAARDDHRARATAGLRDAIRAELAAPAPVATQSWAPRPSLSPTETVAAIRDGIALAAKGDLAAGQIFGRLPHQIERWVCLLSEAEAERLIALPNGMIHRHVTGVADAPGLPPIAGTSTDWRLSPSDMQRLVQRSMRLMKADEAEISAMANRPGAAPRAPLPTEPLYDDEAEAAFRSAPRSGRSY